MQEIRERQLEGKAVHPYREPMPQEIGPREVHWRWARWSFWLALMGVVSLLLTLFVNGSLGLFALAFFVCSVISMIIAMVGMVIVPRNSNTKREWMSLVGAGVLNGAFVSIVYVIAMALEAWARSWEGFGASGRPVRFRRKPLMASSKNNHEWPVSSTVRMIDTKGLRKEQCEKLGELWLKDAQAEHASIAAFSKLSMQLLAVGAPPALISGTHYAALEEVTHAQVCYAMASRYLGKSLGPSSWMSVMKVMNDCPQSRSQLLKEIATESFMDGCIGETIAARVARRSSETAKDPAISKVQTLISYDESNHAKLAWDIVQWCFEQEPFVVGEALQRTIREWSPQNTPSNEWEKLEDFREYGRVASGDYEELQKGVFEESVLRLRGLTGYDEMVLGIAEFRVTASRDCG